MAGKPPSASTVNIKSRKELFNYVQQEKDRMPRLRLCLFSPRGELLIQRRQLRKDRYPGCWDISAGGFVRSGEEPA